MLNDSAMNDTYSRCAAVHSFLQALAGVRVTASLSGHSSLAALCFACFSHRKASRAYDLVDSSTK